MPRTQPSSRPCSVDGCDRPDDARGYCHRHYLQFRALDPNPPAPNAYTEEQRIASFWRRVDRSGGPDACWPWLGSRVGEGYGRVTWLGKSYRAGRLAWELTNNQTMDLALDACHHCDNPPCCNPSHIFPGTPVDNGRDMVNKGRGRGVALNAQRTHCKRGHLLSDENIYLSGRSRQCKTCAKMHWDKANAKRRAANVGQSSTN